MAFKYVCDICGAETLAEEGLATPAGYMAAGEAPQGWAVLMVRPPQPPAPPVQPYRPGPPGGQRVPAAPAYAPPITSMVCSARCALEALRRAGQFLQDCFIKAGGQ